uniref:Small integral membrane protein 4 n=1 Tax=Tabanus bromius TaxID=304241 RepID=A0A0K8TQB2_TABBR
MKFYSRALSRFLDSWPGKKRFGMYRFLPFFFVLGAALEFSMINWTVGETNFYKTFKKRQAKNIVEEKLHDHIVKA